VVAAAIPPLRNINGSRTQPFPFVAKMQQFFCHISIRAAGALNWRRAAFTRNSVARHSLSRQDDSRSFLPDEQPPSFFFSGTRKEIAAFRPIGQFCGKRSV
jgi:hypothetical protein